MRSMFTILVQHVSMLSCANQHLMRSTTELDGGVVGFLGIWPKTRSVKARPDDSDSSSNSLTHQMQTVVICLPLGGFFTHFSSLPLSVSKSASLQETTASKLAAYTLTFTLTWLLIHKVKQTSSSYLSIHRDSADFKQGPSPPTEEPCHCILCLAPPSTIVIG